MRDNRDSGGLGAFLAGVILGGVAVFLIDPKNREMLMKKSEDLKGLAKDKMNEMEEEVEKAKERTKKELGKTLKQAGKKLTTN